MSNNHDVRSLAFRVCDKEERSGNGNVAIHACHVDDLCVSVGCRCGRRRSDAQALCFILWQLSQSEERVMPASLHGYIFNLRFYRQL